MTDNVERHEGFAQVCVWPGVTLGDTTPAEFEKFMLDEFQTRAQFLEIIFTYPDRTTDGYLVEGTGGRSDVFLAIHSEDIGKFAHPRLQAGIRWIEDVYGNGHGTLYPARVKGYKTWDCGDGSTED